MATRFITVSIEIMHDDNLTSNQKFLLAEIEQLSILEKGCIASNEHFSDLIGIAKESVSRSISDLENKGYITTEIKNGSRNHVRVIRINKMLRPPKQNVKTPLIKRQETKENITNNKTNEESVAIAPAPSSSKNVFNDIDMGLALTMYENIKAMHEGFKKPNLESWANEFRLMRTIDKRKPKGMDNFLHSLATESGMWEFWRGNILSPKSMRKNYDKVISQYRKDIVQSSKVVDTSIPLDQRVKALSQSKST